MSDREKLIELIAKAKYICAHDYSDHTEDEYIADMLLDNGVTVGVDAKPLKQYLTQIDEYAGLKLKFLVFKSDTGERIENCFVLRPDKDPAAVEALRAYAEATDNKTLADDIYNWVGNGVTLKKWIPVSERLPEDWENVLVFSKYGFCETAVYLGIPGKWRVTWNHEFLEENSVTHWMPLPEPPKECE